MGNSPLKEGDRVERIRETEHLVVLKGQFSSLTKKKMVEPNLVILMVFFCYWMGDPPSQEVDRKVNLQYYNPQ